MVWPHGIVGQQENLMPVLAHCRHSPNWAISSGKTCPTFEGALAARFLTLWGACPTYRYYCSDKFRRALPKQVVGPSAQITAGFHEFDCSGIAIEIFKAGVQRRLAKAYEDMGTSMFKPGASGNDFTDTNLMSSINAIPFGNAISDANLHFALFREWPTEPSTDALQTDPPDLVLQGLETNQDDTEVLSEEVLARDLRQWKREGQTWISSFMKPARIKVETFLRLNAAANEKAARAAAARRVPGSLNSSDRKAKFDKVEELCLQQSDLRPAARGKIWTWESGSCAEDKYRSISHMVAFNFEFIRSTAIDMGFQDMRAIQELTTSGVTHGTSEFPLNCYFSRNHQGAAVHHDEVTPMIKEKTIGLHFTCPTASDGRKLHAACPHPLSIPCGVIPLNGTEQALKPSEFEKWLDDLPHKLNVRGTFDLSSPHVDDDEDNRSSNSFCDLDPELNMPWVTPEFVAYGAAILRAICSLVLFFKIDLHRSYQQIVMQTTNTWRQYFFWCYLDLTTAEEEMVMGYYRDERRQ